MIYQGRQDGMNQWKSAHAVKTSKRSLADAMEGADIFLGLSVKGAVDQDMIRSMGDKPIIFACANPDPEITPEEVKEARSDAITATGRSDYPNQVNNVLGFPYIFRGALDVRASTINEPMKIAAARALAELAREDVPDEVDAAYSGRRLRYGPDYIIPVPFDPRLIEYVPAAVAKAAMDSGVAQKPILDMDAYRAQLRSRLDPTSASMQFLFDSVSADPKKVVFAEGEEEKMIRAAIAYQNAGYGQAVLVGREDVVKGTAKESGLGNLEGVEIHNARKSYANKQYTDFLYERMQRRGLLRRDCQRLVNQDRNVFAACMVALGDADAMVTGTTRNYYTALEDITRVIDPEEGHNLLGVSLLIGGGRTVFISDVTINALPDAEELADIAIQTAEKARQMGHTPRVALLSFSNFGLPMHDKSEHVREAVKILEQRKVDFEFDGEMAADVALDPQLMELYPFCRLSGPANVLIMPALHSANITSKLISKLGRGKVLGPLLTGLSKPAQIVPMEASANDILQYAVLAAHEAV